MNALKVFGFATALASAVALSTSANAKSIGLSFAGDNGGGTSFNIGAGTAGVVAQGNWNNGTGGAGALTDLVDNSGAATTADVEWTSANTWGGSGASNDAEGLVNGWLDDGGAGATITVTQIPYASYEVIVYGSSDEGNGGNGWNTRINGADYSGGGLFTNLSANGSYFDGTNYVDGLTAAADPSFIRVGGLSGDLTINGIRQTLNGVNARGAVSGFQIIRVPEPASSALLALGAIACGFAARRRK